MADYALDHGKKAPSRSSFYRLLDLLPAMTPKGTNSYLTLIYILLLLLIDCKIVDRENYLGIYLGVEKVN